MNCFSLDLSALRLIAPILASLLLSYTGVAQSPTSASTIPAPPAMQFRTLAGDATPQGLHYEYNKKDVAIDVQKDIRSLPYPYSGESPLVFYRIVNQPDGKVMHEPVVSVDLSSAGKFPLLIFFNDATKPGKLRLVTMKEDAVSYPGTTCRFANFSQTPLQIGFGVQKFILPPGNIVDQKPTNSTVMLAVTAVSQNSSTPLLTHNMLCEPQERYLIVASPAASGTVPVELKRLSDRVTQQP